MDIVVAGFKEKGSVFELLLAQFEEHRIPIAPAELRKAIAGPLRDAGRGLFLLALVNDEAVGVAYLTFTWTLEHGGRSAWLEELYVKPEHRQGGVGQALLNAVCRMAKEQGCAAVDLEVEASQARAEHLYQRAGFRPHQRRRWVKVL